MSLKDDVLKSIKELPGLTVFKGHHVDYNEFFLSNVTPNSMLNMAMPANNRLLFEEQSYLIGCDPPIYDANALKVKLIEITKPFKVEYVFLPPNANEIVCGRAVLDEEVIRLNLILTVKSHYKNKEILQEHGVKEDFRREKIDRQVKAYSRSNFYLFPNLDSAKIASEQPPQEEYKVNVAEKGTKLLATVLSFNRS